MISAEQISHAFSGVGVLHGVSLDARPGEVVGLIGPNGSGKTTMLRTLYRALHPDQGAVKVNGESIGKLPQRDLARAIAVVVQESSGELPLSVADTVLLGRSPHMGTWQRQTDQDIEIAAEALRRVGAEHLAGRDFGVLSGGEKQRVLIARALTQQATHLLMDEPTNHLDIHFQHELLNLVRKLDVTTIIVLHDLNLAARYCDTLVLLDSGQVAAAGPVDAVLTPEVIEPVYSISVQRVIADDGRAQLLFRPSTRHPATHHHGVRAETGNTHPATEVATARMDSHG